MGFYQGLSGLNASEKALNVIGHNISNATTVGYKSQKALFSDMYAGAVGDNALGKLQVGSGTTVSDIATQFKQGTTTQTGGELDIAINGSGFFRMVDDNGQAYYTRNGQFYLDKDGYIRNATARDTILTGFPVDDAGRTIGGVSQPLVIDTPMIEPKQTTEAFLVGNFDSRSKAPTADFTLPTATSTPNPDSYNLAVSNQLYDSLGNPHTFNYYLVKTGPNAWTAFMSVDFGANNNVDYTLNGVTSNYLNLAQFQHENTELDDLLTKYPDLAMAIRDSYPQPEGSATGSGQAAFNTAYANLITQPGYSDLGTLYATGDDFLADADFAALSAYLTTLDTFPDASGDVLREEIYSLRGHAMDIKFNSNGKIVSPLNAGDIEVTITGLQTTTGAFGPGTVTNPTPPPGTVDLGDLTFMLDITGSTQYGQTSAFTKNSSDGYPAGNFSSLEVSDEGLISAKYTNGQRKMLGHVALATFPSVHGLGRVGDNLYTETLNSGQPVVGPAGTGLNGAIVAQSIEESNVDLTYELVQMIIQQRSYQANAQTIKTQDSILQTAVNLR